MCDKVGEPSSPCRIEKAGLVQPPLWVCVLVSQSTQQQDNLPEDVNGLTSNFVSGKVRFQRALIGQLERALFGAIPITVGHSGPNRVEIAGKGVRICNGR
jgi:hypothetical protein